MVELNHFKFFIGKKLFARAFRRCAGALEGPILDVGAGSKPFRRYVLDARWVTMDIEPRLRPDVAAAAHRMPFRDQTFGSALCTEVLEHVPEPAACLAEIRRLLKPGGHLYLTAPMLWPLHYEPHDYYRYTSYGLRHVIEKAGFESVETAPIGGLFSFVCMRLGEKIFNLIHKAAFFLPKDMRFIVSVPLTLPVFYLLYLLSFVFDPLMKKDVFAWRVLARTPTTGR